MLPVQPLNQWIADAMREVVGSAVDASCKEVGIDTPERRAQSQEIAYAEILKSVLPAGNC